MGICKVERNSGYWCDVFWWVGLQDAADGTAENNFSFMLWLDKKQAKMAAENI